MLKLFRITTVPISLKTLLKGQHQFMSKYYDVTGVSSAGSELEDVAKDEGIKVVGLEMTRVISPFKDLCSLVNMVRLFKKEKPFIVHTHTPKAGIVGMFAAKIAGVPVRLHTVAGLPLMETMGVKRRVLNFVEKFTYSCATAVYPNSNGLYDFIVKERFASPNKLNVIANGSSNGINTSFFSSQHYSLNQKLELRKTLGIDKNDFVFIFVGRLVGDKGINELIEAYKKISNEINNTKLLLVGPVEHELDPLITSTLMEIENNPNIISVGYQTDVRPYFLVSDVLVFPSYREGFPNVVMQAGSMGLPSIVSDINGCNEIIIEGENGIIIPPKDKKGIYEGMIRLLSDRDLMNKLKSNSRKMIVERYEQKVVWDALLLEYKRLEKDVQKYN
ncbi:glycosyltransferase family 4 protein [Pedobacter panaciterrae]|uniref:Glycosyltransferase family 4 protein n=2 Tax=Pedobacter panaciterrae TaxID=363849 RepID=A0ABU8NU94_9SPHI